MNKQFNGHLNAKSHKGQHSKAAMAAFRDIRRDPDMKVKIEMFGKEVKRGVILTEDILDVDVWGL